MIGLSVPMQLTVLHGKNMYIHLIATALVCAALIAAFFLINKRFVKIVCACGIEVMIWLAARAVWGKDSLPAQILCYITAAAVIIVTIAIVNRIDWSNMGPKKYI